MSECECVCVCVRASECTCVHKYTHILDTHDSSICTRRRYPFFRVSYSLPAHVKNTHILDTHILKVLIFCSNIPTFQIFMTYPNTTKILIFYILIFCMRTRQRYSYSRYAYSRCSYSAQIYSRYAYSRCAYSAQIYSHVLDPHDSSVHLKNTHIQDTRCQDNHIFKLLIFTIFTLSTRTRQRSLATKCRSLLRKITCKDNRSYGSSPPCTHIHDIHTFYLHTSKIPIL